MATTTIYRADDYYNNMGDLLGFFDNLEDAKNELEFSKEATSPGDGTFSQITEFTVLTSEFKKGDIKDKKFMMEIWENKAEIVKDYYYSE